MRRDDRYILQINIDLSQANNKPRAYQSVLSIITLPGVLFPDSASPRRNCIRIPQEISYRNSDQLVYFCHCKYLTPLLGHQSAKNTVIPDLRGPLSRDPDSTSVGFVLWMPASAGMTNR
jgi:hypothetical protein